MTVADENLHELNATAFDILCRELGLSRALRVFSQMQLGLGDYTADRHKWLGGMTDEDFERECRALDTAEPQTGNSPSR